MRPRALRRELAAAHWRSLVRDLPGVLLVLGCWLLVVGWVWERAKGSFERRMWWR